MNIVNEQQVLPSSEETVGASVSARPLIRLWALGLVLTFFLLITLVLYHPAFNARMVYDSKEWIEGKAHVFATHDPIEVMGIVPVRPLFMMSLYLNYLWSGMEPFSFRAINAMILALSGLVLVVLSLLIFEMPGTRCRGGRAIQPGHAGAQENLRILFK